MKDNLLLCKCRLTGGEALNLYLVEQHRHTDIEDCRGLFICGNILVLSWWYRESWPNGNALHHRLSVICSERLPNTGPLLCFLATQSNTIWERFHGIRCKTFVFAQKSTRTVNCSQISVNFNTEASADFRRVNSTILKPQFRTFCSCKLKRRWLSI